MRAQGISSSETQGQVEGAGKKLGQRKVKNFFPAPSSSNFSSPQFFPAPSSCPWVSEDEGILESLNVFLYV